MGCSAIQPVVAFHGPFPHAAIEIDKAFRRGREAALGLELPGGHSFNQVAGCPGQSQVCEKWMGLFGKDGGGHEIPFFSRGRSDIVTTPLE